MLPLVKMEEMKLSSWRRGKAVTPLRNKPNMTITIAMRIFFNFSMAPSLLRARARSMPLAFQEFFTICSIRKVGWSH